jgi:hypothetical protein
MNFFEVDAQQVVHFQNTEQLGREINSLIETLRDKAGTLDPELGAFVKKKTPGPNKVALAVKLVLRNNGFDLKKNQFVYQGKVGVVTRPINAKLNQKLRALTGDRGMPEIALAAYLDRSLQSSRVPAAVAGPLANALAHVVIAESADDVPPPTPEDFQKLGREAAGALKSASATAASLGDVFEIDRERSLVRFRNTDALAEGINGVIRDLRNLASSVPGVGPALGQHVREKTPGPTVVKKAIEHGLADNAFNYDKLEFESQGWRIGTTKLVNHYLNKELDAQKRRLLSVPEMTRMAMQLWIARQHLQALPAAVRSPVARQLATTILAMANEQAG